MIDKEFRWEITFKNVPKNKVKRVSLESIDVECYEDAHNDGEINGIYNKYRRIK